MTLHISFILLLVLFFTNGCATNITKPRKVNEPATIKFSTFDNVVMKYSTISGERNQAGITQKKTIRTIDENLSSCMRVIFPNLRVTKDNSASGADTLIITPQIKGIRFISRATRFWAGPLAGKSAVSMQVTFTDDLGKVLAKPEFYSSAAARIDAADQRILKEVADDICGYALFNM